MRTFRHPPSLTEAPPGRSRRTSHKGGAFLALLLVASPLAAVAVTSSAVSAAPVNAAAPTLIADTTPSPVVTGHALDLGSASSSQPLRVVIGLRTPHPVQETAFLHALQDRTSPLFHHFLTATEWNARFAPTAGQQQAVIRWAKASGLRISKTYANRLQVDTTGTVGNYERAFSVHLNDYREGGTSFFSNSGPIVVPAAVGSLVQSVNGLDDYRLAQSSAAASTKASGRSVAKSTMPAYAAGPVTATGPAAKKSATHVHAGRETVGGVKPAGSAVPLDDGLISPQNLWSSSGYDESALYAQSPCCTAGGTLSQSSIDSTIAISTVGSFDGNDLATYAAKSASYVDGTTLAYNYDSWYIDGTPTCCGLETTLDVESATAMANSFGSSGATAKVIVYEGANSGLGTLLDVDNFILSQDETRIFTTSWGLDEADTGSSTMNSFHNVFNAMAGQGWTMDAATGDSGAYDNGSVSVDYPASDPDVIASGGSELHLNSDGTYNYETTWNSGGGGCSTYWATPSYQSGLSTGCSSRALPDISLNASNNTAEVLWYDGGTNGNTSQLYSVWGTSEVAPELAGIWAVENSYLLSFGSRCGSAGTAACAPLGDPHSQLYLEAGAGGGGRAPHYPFYDVTTGNNDNGHGTGTYSAGPGYDVATGWGSINALELARGFNWERVWDSTAPTVAFSNPTPGRWYNTDQEVSWTVADPIDSDPASSGVAGFSQGWDSLPADSFRLSTPGGTSDSFYSGSEFPNATSGYMLLSWAGQGCHTAYVEAWDNVGYASGDQSPGTFCYDTSTPSAHVSIDGGSTYTRSTSANLSIGAANPTGGDPVTSMRFSIDGGSYGAWSTYSPSATVAVPGGAGTKTVSVEVDNAAGTISPAASDSIVLDQTAPTMTKAPAASIRTTALTSGGVGITVTWAATDATSGVQSYGLRERINGGSWKTVTLANSSETSVNLTLPTGTSYQFEVDATDKAGNVSAYRVANEFTLSLYQENASSVAYSAHWTRQVLNGASGGDVDYTATAGATANLSFDGTEVAWVSTVGSTRGNAAVHVDGGSSTTVNTEAAATTTKKVVYVVNVAAGNHHSWSTIRPRRARPHRRRRFRGDQLTATPQSG